MGHKHAYTNATKAYTILYSSKVRSCPSSVGKGPVSEVALNRFERMFTENKKKRGKDIINRKRNKYIDAKRERKKNGIN